MKKAIVFRHVPHEGLGLVEEFFHRHSIQIDYQDLFVNRDFSVRPDDYEMIVSMGGPMNVDEIEKYPFLEQERSFIQKAVQLEKPVLGICLGAQMVARSLGARVYPGGRKEIGWFPIHLSAFGKTDSVFRYVTDSKPMVFHWHGDTFDLPKGAVLLSSSDLFQHQAFRYGNHVYAFQFHIEVTPEMVKDWVLKGSEELESVKSYVSRQAILDGIGRYAASLRHLANSVFQGLESELFNPISRQ